MRWRSAWLSVVLAGAALLPACGTEATGVSLDIEPDPVIAQRVGEGTYAAEWDAVVSDLTGVGGTIESIDASVMGATAVTTNSDRSNPPIAALPSTNLAVEAFQRKLFHDSARFTASPGQSVSVKATVRFRDGNGVSHQQSAEARVSLP
jgi:hypothetical protein